MSTMSLSGTTCTRDTSPLASISLTKSFQEMLPPLVLMEFSRLMMTAMIMSVRSRSRYIWSSCSRRFFSSGKGQEWRRQIKKNKLKGRSQMCRFEQSHVSQLKQFITYLHPPLDSFPLAHYFYFFSLVWTEIYWRSLLLLKTKCFHLE